MKANLEIDGRSREEIIDQLTQLAESYTPQWRFGAENGDAGTALAMIFGDMLYETKEKLNLLFEKNKIEFFNRLNVNLLPAKASLGYVFFGLVSDEVTGVEVESGTRVIGETGDAVHCEASFETLEPVFVSPAGITEIYQVSDIYDSIKREEKKEEGWSFKAFHSDMPNLQQHEIYIAHSELLHISTSGCIELRLYKNYRELMGEEVLHKLADRNLAALAYYSEEGYVEFEDAEVKDGAILLYKGEGQPQFVTTALMKADSCFIRIQIKKAEDFSGVSCYAVKLRSRAYEILPQVIHGDGIQCDQTEYRPFGRKMGIYKEVLFGSSEVLSKTGARVHLRFKLEFEKIPLETNVVHKINWKWKMKETDFEKEPEYDISIAEVIWEYYGKNGWHRLFKTQLYSDVFTFQGRVSAQYKEIIFDVPADMVRTVIGSEEAYYIRARILSMNHEYKTNGYYITPLLSETTFDFAYHQEVLPQWVIHANNTEMYCMKGNEIGENNKLSLVKQAGVNQNSIYMGFRVPPVGNPIKILFSVERGLKKKPGPLRWEYYAKGGFKELVIMDETEHLSKTGIVTFAGENKFVKNCFFGKMLYWIRITDTYDYYGQGNEDFPGIHGIYMNVTKARACKSFEKQSFRIDRYETSKQLMLGKGEILSLTLWVNEGIEQEKWIQWEEVEELLDSKGDDRHYMLDAWKGMITFGNGICGKVPEPSQRPNIRVEYRSGGGSYTNIEPYMIKKLGKSKGFINKVNNPMAFSGGCDRESEEAAIKRSAAGLRHRGKAVTVSDYEEIVMEYSGSIHKATCFKHQDGQGNYKPGNITICVVQKEYEKGYLYFEELRGQLLSYLKKHAEQSVIQEDALHIVEPVLLKICADIKVCAAGYDEVFEVKHKVTGKLEEFLHPFTGNIGNQGFAIAEIPDIARMKNAVHSVAGVTAIPHMQLSYYAVKGNEEREIDLSLARGYPYLLSVSGRHRVTVVI